MTPRTAVTFSIGFAAALAGGWLAFPRLLYVASRQPLQFNHAVHASKASMACTDCHMLRADGSFSGIPSLSTCAGCHAEPIGATTEEKRLVTEFVRPGREIPWHTYARQPDNVRFPHAPHVKQGALSCERCHGDHGSSVRLADYEVDRLSGYTRDTKGMGECKACHRHDGRGTACIACHK